MLKANEAQVMVQVLGGWDSKQWDTMQKLLTISRLAKKHHRLAEMECNGEGYVRGKWYRLDGSTPGAYIEWVFAGGGECRICHRTEMTEINTDKVCSACFDGTSVFTVESDKVEAKITALVGQLGAGWTVEFQGDPRGNTVKVSHNNRQIDLA